MVNESRLVETWEELATSGNLPLRSCASPHYRLATTSSEALWERRIELLLINITINTANM